MNRFILIEFFLFCCLALPAQNKMTMSSITLVNGEVVKGYIQHDSDGTYTVTSVDGSVTYYSEHDVKSEVVGKKPIEKKEKKEKKPIVKDDPRYRTDQYGFSIILEGLCGTQFGCAAGGFSLISGYDFDANWFLGGKLGFMTSGRRVGNVDRKEMLFLDRSVIFPAIDVRYSFWRSMVTPYIGASIGLSINRPQSYSKYSWEEYFDIKDWFLINDDITGGYPGNCSFHYEISGGVRVRIPNPQRGYYEKTSGWFGVALCGFSNRPSLVLKAGLSF